jgi:DNA-binding NarL/FixJ family response regulator
MVGPLRIENTRGAEGRETDVVDVLVVDDDALVRAGLRLALRSVSGIRIVAEASSGNGAISALEQTPVDVVLMDVHMKSTNGIAATQVMRVRHPRIRIVLMSAFADEEFVVHARNVGADAFVPKEAALGEFAKAILGSRQRTLDGARDAGGSVSLSPQEHAVADRVAQGRSNEQIAAELNLSVNTVKTYASRIFTKVGVKNRVQLANLVNKQ